MKAIILAGGKGTRLQSVVSDVPKPMAPVGGKPFLEYLLLQLVKYNIKDIIISIGYKGHLISSYFGDGRKWGISITYSEETSSLGTGGATKRAFQLVTEDVAIVMNGDSFFDLDLKRLLLFHEDHRTLATIALVRVENSGRYGKVTLSESGIITTFDEKTDDAGGLINSGVYVLNKPAFLQRVEDVFSLEHDLFPDMVGKGLLGMVQEGFFLDIGLPSDYKRLYNEPFILQHKLGRNSNASGLRS